MLQRLPAPVHGRERQRMSTFTDSLWPFRDPVSASSHLMTCVFAVYCTLILWRLASGDRAKRLSLACFGLSMTLLYAASGTYHALALPPDSPARLFFRRLDHSAIYGLIAGTYTPVVVVLLRGRVRTSMLALIWTLAAVGVALKWLLPLAPSPLTVGLYLAMGWVGLLPVRALVRAAGAKAMAWGAFGGVLYTAGALCELFRWPVVVPGVVGPHEMMHFFDVGGTAVHYSFMMWFVLPYPSGDPTPTPASLRTPLTAGRPGHSAARTPTSSRCRSRSAGSW
jgi:hemolysin III